MGIQKYKSILVFSCLHYPYEHPDAIPFLAHIKKTYKPDLVVNLGDEIDSHAMSFHQSDSDLLSAGNELKLSIKKLSNLYKLFPETKVLDSNHGSMCIRKAKHNGIPIKYLAQIGQVLEAPHTWTWHNELIVTMSNNQKVLFKHGHSKKTLRMAQESGMCFVQGHFHTLLRIEYSATPEQLIWSAQVGCLIDDKSMAFAYNKANFNRPALGCLVIQDGLPILIPMDLNKNKRWKNKQHTKKHKHKRSKV